jgi:hypothetical protein
MRKAQGADGARDLRQAGERAGEWLGMSAVHRRARRTKLMKSKIHKCAEAKSGRARTHASRRAMLNRCLNPRSKEFDVYGGAGVTVCARWNPARGGSFANFLADLGERPKNTTLGRVGDENLYGPGSCFYSLTSGATRSCGECKDEVPGPRLTRTTIDGRNPEHVEFLRF